MIAASALGYAADLQPWHQTDLELYPKLDLLYQNYSKINSSAHSKNVSANDCFVTFGISSSYSAWDAFLELTCADTRRQSFGFDNFRITGRFQWLSDIIDDPVTLTTGLVLTGASETALHDISSFHHGTFEAEANVSVGKEIECLQDWVIRYWGVFGIGIGNHGSPWVRGDLAWEKNFCQDGVLRLFANTLWGWGNHSLHVRHFKDYGPVRHRSLDLGLRLTKATPCWGTFYIEYAYRIIASNFPARTNLLLFSYTYPFGL